MLRLDFSERSLEVQRGVCLLYTSVKAKGYASNAANLEDTAKVVEEIHKDFGRIDILAVSYTHLFAEFIVVDIVSHTAGVTWAGADNGDVA